jgi:hypothetical protein
LRCGRMDWRNDDAIGITLEVGVLVAFEDPTDSLMSTGFSLITSPNVGRDTHSGEPSVVTPTNPFIKSFVIGDDEQIILRTASETSQVGGSPLRAGLGESGRSGFRVSDIGPSIGLPIFGCRALRTRLRGLIAAWATGPRARSWNASSTVLFVGNWGAARSERCHPDGTLCAAISE